MSERFILVRLKQYNPVFSSQYFLHGRVTFVSGSTDPGDGYTSVTWFVTFMSRNHTPFCRGFALTYILFSRYNNVCPDYTGQT